MTTFVWRQGLRGPSPSVNMTDTLDEWDRKKKLVSYKLPKEHEKLSLQALIELYPAPKESGAITTPIQLGTNEKTSE